MTIAAELRERARVLREERTWVQGNPKEPGEACLLFDGDKFVLTSDAYEALADYLGNLVTYWQDRPGRTLDEVCAALIGCAEQLEAQGS